ncbi:MAG: SDR family oxidoreductase [Candidatus Methylacidiphilales bacterium]|nr:SDR family oxidoreductase [Candidatus Methylacidiphilales bacterium]
MKPSIVVVTGASSGIGEGFARAFVARGHRVLLVARRHERLESLARELGPLAEIFVEDVADPDAPARILARVAALGATPGGLVNNAGLGKQAGLVRMSEDDITAMLRVNVESLVRLTRLFLPGMCERRSGFILNIASTAAFQPVPYFAVYAASKAFVVSFSEAVHEEARGFGVHVGCLCPGPVDTEFQQVAGMNPRFFARSQSVGEVVRAGMGQLEGQAAVAWTSAFQELFSFSVRFVPRCWVRRIAARLMKASGAE